MPEVFVPDWPAPANIGTLQTLRGGGCSPAPWDSLNLGDHVGDDPACVAANRARLRGLLPADPVWLQQVHGTTAVDIANTTKSVQADAAFCREPGRVCAVMTADCLPVLFCDRAGSVVAAAHAGWRGLLGGVLEATINAMQVPGEEILVWLGPAIGPHRFEVGQEVKEAFVAVESHAAKAFRQLGDGQWLADLYLLARQRLNSVGITAIYGEVLCTFSDEKRFFSYRRDGVTGRMASLIWLR